MYHIRNIYMNCINIRINNSSISVVCPLYITMCEIFPVWKTHCDAMKMGDRVKGASQRHTLYVCHTNILVILNCNIVMSMDHPIPSYSSSSSSSSSLAVVLSVSSLIVMGEKRREVGNFIHYTPWMFGGVSGGVSPDVQGCSALGE